MSLVTEVALVLCLFYILLLLLWNIYEDHFDNSHMMPNKMQVKNLECKGKS